MKKLYCVKHQGEGIYLSENLTYALRFIALRMKSNLSSATVQQAVNEGYGISCV